MTQRHDLEKTVEVARILFRDPTFISGSWLGEQNENKDLYNLTLILYFVISQAKNRPTPRNEDGHS